jgi:hypothetical protein
MPTAVERLFKSFLNSFLDFDDNIPRERLSDAFENIDSDLKSLSSLNGDGFSAFEAKHKGDFTAIGNAFGVVGDDFHKGEVAGRLADAIIAVLGGGSDSPIQADFVALDAAVNVSSTDLKTLGTDFAKLGAAPDPATFALDTAAVKVDYLKIEADMTADSTAFMKAGGDLVKLGTADNPSPLDLAYKELGGELRTMGTDFGLLATDFRKVEAAFSGSGGAGTPVGTALTHIFQDLQTLGKDTVAAADGSVRVIDDLIRLAVGNPNDLLDFDEGINRGKLHHALEHIDGDFKNLSSLTGDNFEDFQDKHKGDFAVIGNAFGVVGDDFHKGEVAGRLADAIIAVLGGGGGASASNDGGHGTGKVSDFAVLDAEVNRSSTDLKTLGTDFVKLGAAPDPATFALDTAAVKIDYLKIEADMSADSAAIMKVGADLVALGTHANPSPLDLAYKELGGELQTMGTDFGLLATDFRKAAAAFSGSGGAGTPVGETLDKAFSGGGLGVGAPLGQIFRDFRTLGHDTSLAITDGASDVIQDLFHQALGTSGHS